MITRVQVKNFRNLADVDVTLGPLTVLVGRNGAGKSTFLDVFRFVRDTLWFNLDTAITQRGGISALRRHSPQGELHDVEVKIETSSGPWSRRYAFSIGSREDNTYYVKYESCRVEGPFDDGLEAREFASHVGEPVNLRTWAAGGMSEETDLFVAQSSLLLLPAMSVLHDMSFGSVNRVLRDIDCYALFSLDVLRAPQKATSEGPLTESGENLSATLEVIKRNRFYPDLILALGHIVEGVSDFRVEEVGGYLVTELRYDTTKGLSTWFELARESDGTLRTLALLTALYQATTPLFLGIEEPELHMHPGALAVLADVIKEASLRTQVLITTQSPDLISEFAAEDLRVVERTADGTRIGPVDDIQLQIINEQLFSGGDLLRIEGLHLNPEQAAA